MEAELTFDLRSGAEPTDDDDDQMFTEDENRLSDICQRMEQILKKIASTERHLTAPVDRKQRVSGALWQRLRTLKSIYNFHHEAATHVVHRLERFGRQRQPRHQATVTDYDRI